VPDDPRYSVAVAAAAVNHRRGFEVRERHASFGRLALNDWMAQQGAIVNEERAAHTSEAMVVVEGLVKHYGATKAVDGISFRVQPGEVFGLLGHNGAGKTTTIRMLTGRSRPTAGRATIAGYDIVTDLPRIKPLINLVFEEQNLYERFPGRELLHIFADLYEVPRARADELLELVGLDDAAARRRIKTYSTGMKQRLLIARALINAPRVLFLDEPTRGLDPASARELRAIVARLSREGTTILLTTHYMEEADELCHRVAFLSQGHIVALDSPRNLKLRYGQRTATVLLRGGREQTLRLADPGDALLLAGWMSAGDVLAIHSNEGTLEDVFIALAGRSLHDGVRAA
jgi:ABC-2 type transport system ATP-binding protein